MCIPSYYFSWNIFQIPETQDQNDTNFSKDKALSFDPNDMKRSPCPKAYVTGTMAV